MKIDIEVPRKYVRTIWIIVSGLFRIAKGIFKRYSPFLFAMMKRRNSFRPIRDTLASIEDMNRKLRDAGNNVQSLKTGLISELRSSVKHSSNINFAVLLRGRPSIPVHGFLVLEFIKFYPGRWWAPLWQKTRDERRSRAGVRRLPSPPLPLGKIS